MLTLEDNQSTTGIKNQRRITDTTPYALADELIECDITFHMSGTTDGGTTTNQHLTRTRDETNPNTTNSLGFHPKINPIVTFDSNSKVKDNKQLIMDFKVLNPTLQLDKKQKMLYTPLRFKTYEVKALQNGKSESELRKVSAALPEAVIRERPVPEFRKFKSPTATYMKSKNKRTYVFQAGRSFEESLVILRTKTKVLIGRSFLQTYSVNLDVKNLLVHLPDTSRQVCEKPKRST